LTKIRRLVYKIHGCNPCIYSTKYTGATRVSIQGEALTAPALADIYKFIRKSEKRKEPPAKKIRRRLKVSIPPRRERLQGSDLPR